MAWMPLNNHPTAKPTYDIYDTVPVGKTAISAGELVGATPGRPSARSADLGEPARRELPAGGSWTWHWHSPEPIASYLLEHIGSYDLTARTTTSGIQYYQAQASGLTAARKATIKAVLDTQEDITNFQSQFNGPCPFTTDGVIVGLPNAGFEEEMQTKITFANGAASTPSRGAFHHENMHQWFGDNVSEGGFRLTFWKEGWATVGEYLNTARTRQRRGRPGHAGRQHGLRQPAHRPLQHELRDDERRRPGPRRPRTRPSGTSSPRRARTRGRGRPTSRCARSSTGPPRGPHRTVGSAR